MLKEVKDVQNLNKEIPNKLCHANLNQLIIIFSVSFVSIIKVVFKASGTALKCGILKNGVLITTLL